ncbi:MAG TPA: hypothetical protein VGC41_11340 [Kofleriaceae bacterium]
MRPLWLLGIAGMLSTAHADEAGKQKVATAIDAGDAKALRALVSGRIVLEHVWFFDPTCAKKFSTDGMKDVPDADLQAFVTCLKGTGAKHDPDQGGAYLYDPGAYVRIVLFDKPNGKPQLAFAGSMANGSPYVSNQLMDSHRTSGKAIEPDAATKAATAKDPNAVAYAEIRYCTDPAGKVKSADIVFQGKSFPAYATHAVEQVKTWTFKPFLVKTTAVGVCSGVNIHYPQDRKIPLDLDVPEDKDAIPDPYAR